MLKKMTTLICTALLITSTAFAESYTFSDSTYTQVEDYSWGGAPAAVSSNTLSVGNTLGQISDLNVTINGLNSGGLIDMTFVLVSPDNTGVVLSSNAGGGGNTGTAKLKDLDLTFDDQATSIISQPSSLKNAKKTAVPEGSYQTSVYAHPSWHYWNGSYALLDPVNSGIFGDVNFAEENLLSAFDDISANGDWQLLAYDNLVYDSLSFTGWSLNITTTGGGASAVPEPAEWALILTCLITGLGIKFYNDRKTRLA